MSAVGEDRKRLLGDIELLDGLGAEALESLAREVRWVEVPAGSEVIIEGAPSSSARETRITGSRGRCAPAHP